MVSGRPLQRRLLLVLTICAAAAGARALTVPAPARAQNAYLFNDSHFHLTNYIQEGTDIRKYLEMMGATVGRSTLFGIPLQQTWSHANSGNFGPTYYTQTDAPLYYYSFTDAWIAMAYRSLPREQQGRLDPMITGFNPADMYAVDHIKRVLKTFPGVFSGIGEFSIHKEFVSSKVAGPTASLTDPALDRILAFAGEAGMVVILHNDLDVPFPKPEQDLYMLRQLKELYKRHPKTTIIWAHCGMGRVVRPIKDAATRMDGVLADPGLKHVYFDISWDEVAKYIVASPESLQATADLLNRYPDRFLFGSDVVAPGSIEAQMKVYRMYDPLWSALKPEAREKITRDNYERLFDAARRRVRAWEQEHLKGPQPPPALFPQRS